CAHAPRGWPLLAALRAKNKVKRGTSFVICDVESADNNDGEGRSLRQIPETTKAKQVTVLSARASQSANRTGLTGFSGLTGLFFVGSERSPHGDTMSKIDQFQQVPEQHPNFAVLGAHITHRKQILKI
ncbi:MAG: hypothetical protein LGR52_07945, partial [Candidatus Thiosymbion ectosymbiont of Robbea hypermnestra]|nr:hypothetical protein [Candidatus Thiosymbion ectosymbiont of Robbea hypermnestra]